MGELDWVVDRTLHTKRREAVQVLQRRLPLPCSSQSVELLPFTELPSLFQLTGAQGDRKVSKGIMVSMSAQGDTLTATIHDSQTGTDAVWRLSPLRDVILSVWRINGALDTVQVNFYADGARFYMQTGGQRLLDLITSVVDKSETCDAVRIAQAVFVAIATADRMTWASSIEAESS
jgi:hypothetical protein